MTYTIHKGKHLSYWSLLRCTFGYNKSIIRRRVVFAMNSSYSLNGADQHDVNKLFGLSFVEWYRAIWIFISWPVFAFLSRNRHHQDSARIGWRYDPKSISFILSAYCYVNGERIIQDICHCCADQELIAEIAISPTFYDITIHQYNRPIGHITIPFTHNKKFSYSLGLYFGGNRTAPHTMNIKIEKV